MGRCLALAARHLLGDHCLGAWAARLEMREEARLHDRDSNSEDPDVTESEPQSELSAYYGEPSSGGIPSRRFLAKATAASILFVHRLLSICPSWTIPQDNENKFGCQSVLHSR
jgi:hypothetical protein